MSARKIFLAAVATLGFVAASQAATYNGNGGTGFAGPVGNSVLTVTDGGASVNFSLATSGFEGNSLVFYFDTIAGGENNNSTYTDTGGVQNDVGRRTISGLSEAGRSLVTFPVGFGADFGAAIQPNAFAGLFNLSTPSTFGFVSSGGIAGVTPTVTFSFLKTDLGLPATGDYTFNFVATLLNSGAFRSNETIGASVTTPDLVNNPTSAPNAGNTGTQVFSLANTFTTVVPEPTSLALLGLGGLAVLRRRRA